MPNRPIISEIHGLLQQQVTDEFFCFLEKEYGSALVLQFIFRRDIESAHQ
jgi:hypothetical protein